MSSCPNSLDRQQKAVDPGLRQKLASFHALKSSATQPKHFNDSLLSNKGFRNPHIYDKLVAFVDIDESASGAETSAWSFPQRLHTEPLAESLSKAQSSYVTSQRGKRHSIVFERSSSCSRLDAPPRSDSNRSINHGRSNVHRAFRQAQDVKEHARQARRPQSRPKTQAGAHDA